MFHDFHSGESGRDRLQCKLQNDIFSLSADVLSLFSPIALMMTSFFFSFLFFLIIIISVLDQRKDLSVQYGSQSV